jgi:hypothetical protein
VRVSAQVGDSSNKDCWEVNVEPPENPLGVIVLGAGRSGTSAIARAFVDAGFFAGHDEDLLGPAPSNPLGHFEPLPVLRVNEQLLERFGCSWWADAPPPEDQLPYRAEVIPRLKATLESVIEAADGAPVAIKEPRINGLLPLWQPAIEGVLHPVLTVRDPIEIALSHVRRDATSIGHALAAWEAQTALVLDWLDERPVTIAPYAQLMAEPVLAEELLLDVSSHLAPEQAGQVDPGAARAALRPDLRHERGEGLIHGDYLTGRQAELWRYLEGLPAGGASLEVPAQLQRPSEAARMAMRRESERVDLFESKTALEAELRRVRARVATLERQTGDRTVRSERERP